MEVIFEAFLDYGGPWLATLGVLTWIVSIQGSQSEDGEGADRKSKNKSSVISVLSTKWLRTTAVSLALLSWICSFGSIFLGMAYLRGTGEWPELSMVLLGLILTLSIVAWRGKPLFGFKRSQPWITYGLVVGLICFRGTLLVDAPEQPLIPGSRNHAVTFALARLKDLGCFKAVCAPEPRTQSFDERTASAVISFQLANDLLEDERTAMGLIRPEWEFRFLARPYPFGPHRCPPPERDPLTNEPCPGAEDEQSYP